MGSEYEYAKHCVAKHERGMHINVSELSSTLRAKHTEWWKAICDKDWDTAVWLANDIESLGRRMAIATHELHTTSTR